MDKIANDMLKLAKTVVAGAKLEILDPSGRVIVVKRTNRKVVPTHAVVLLQDTRGLKQEFENDKSILEKYLEKGHWTQEEVDKAMERKEKALKSNLDGKWRLGSLHVGYPNAIKGMNSFSGLGTIKKAKVTEVREV